MNINFKITHEISVRFFILFCCITISANRLHSATSGDIVLNPDNFVLLVSKNEKKPVLLAVEALKKDFGKVLGYTPQIVTKVPKGKIPIVIINDEIKSAIPASELKELDGFESHRVWSNPDKQHIYLYGKDMRGAIYAIYTFSEEILGVPPLWYFCSWQPQLRDTITVPSAYDYYRPSPQVRYRAWFPNDQDMYTPWRKISVQNDEILYETMLRSKLNTLEVGATVSYPYKMTKQAETIGKYGLIITSHHMVALNNSWSGWDNYWKKIRKMQPPALKLAHREALKEFWKYNAETVHQSGIENLWLIAFRGKNDAPFWSLFKDSPKSDKERGEVATEMLRLQYEIIKEITGEEFPYVRVTFYDEMSDLLAAGYLKPPTEKNMIWTFVAARRDHYPNNDLIDFDSSTGVALGYYMNFQFTSTGAHLAQAEGPWKMEFNYRYVNSKAPLYFSVVNSGNQREFLFNLSANAQMMWDMKNYNSDKFTHDFCAKYFGTEYAEEAAILYLDFFYSYWQQKQPDFEGGMERQYIFQDLRYARVFQQLSASFKEYSDNPLKDIGFERIPGRTFRIEGNNQVDSLIEGMALTYPKFDAVVERAQILIDKLEPPYRTFFRDNLLSQAAFMGALSRSLYHFMVAYKMQEEREIAIQNLDSSIKALEEARDWLYSNQEGNFATWYEGDTSSGKFNLPRTIERLITVRDNI